MAQRYWRPEFIAALEVFARISNALDERGFRPPILVGGAAVELYTEGAVATGDFDVVTVEQDAFELVLREHGFHPPPQAPDRRCGVGPRRSEAGVRGRGRFPPATLDLGALFPLVGPADAATARYEGALSGIPNPDIMLSPLTAREAVLSSKIERTQVTLIGARGLRRDRHLHRTG